ncbi:MAG: EAL domain-containing protein [Marinicellaceae bacterium]
MVKNLILFGICFLYFSLVSAQQRLDFDKINIEDGLSHSSVLDMIQDKKGFIWVGTQYGLNRYDGYNFETYNFNVDDPHSISSDFILSIFEDSSGLIWVGTSNGLNSFNPESTKFTRYLPDPNEQESISNGHITSIIEDQLGYIWIGTVGGGINRFDKKSNTFQTIPLKFNNNQKSSYITALLLDHNNQIWAASGNARLRPSQDKGGIFKVNPENLKSEQIIPKIGNKFLNEINGINAIYEDNKNNLWFGTLGQGLLRKNASSGDFSQYFEDIISNQNTILDITQDLSGHLWIATRYSGIFNFDIISNSLTNYNASSPTKSNLNDNDVTSLLIDSTGVFWLGTWTDGINRFDFESFQFKNFLQHKSNPQGQRYQILGINEDSLGRIWLAAWENGLLEFDKDSGNTTKHDLKSIDEKIIIRSLYVDDKDALWLGSNDHGLVYYEPHSKNIKNYQYDINNPYSLSSNQIIDIISDQLGNLWIATRGGGVNYFNMSEKKFYTFNEDSLGIDNRVSTLFYEESGFLWVGGYEGLYILDTQNKQLMAHYTGDQNIGSFIGKDINDIYQDKNKQIWIGTENGFSKVIFNANKDRTKLTFDWSNETLIGSVGGILEDAEGHLWVSSFKKIIRYNTADKKIINFDSSHGVLPSGYYIGSSHQDKNQNMYFGGLDGFSTFHANDIQYNIQKPKVELTNLLLFNKVVSVNSEDFSVLTKSINYTDTIHLDYKQNVFSIEFAALHFASSKDNKYAYKLEGFDKTWNYSSSKNRRATYTNLDPGTYHFHLKASNKDGVWSNQEKKLSIHMHAAPWRTTLAYFIYFLIFSSVVGGFIWLRYKQVQAIKLRNEQLNLTSKLFENTSECVWLLDHQFKFLAVNQGLCEVTGFSEEDLIGRKIKPAEIKGLQDSNFTNNIFKSINLTGRWSGEMWEQRANGEVYPVEIVIDRIAIKNTKKNFTEYQYVGVFSDITHRKKTEEDLRKMAFFDPLTDLANRSYFKILVQKQIDQQIHSGEFIIFYFDLDNFKDINDSIGHSFGDKLLIIIAKRLLKLSDNNYIVARLGGDEFAIMVPQDQIMGSTQDFCNNFSQKILKKVNKKIKIKGYNSYITASIGISVYPSDGNNHEELLRNADTAMYHAKKRGRNAVIFFSKSMNETARERLMLVDELNNAIKANEFMPFYQPKVSLKTGKLTGVEVLARWNNKKLGMVPSERFISVAEESKLITDISEQLMKKACHFLLPIIQKGQFHGRVSFNVSITQFMRGDLVSWIDRILDECNFPAEYVELEITESMVMKNIDKAIEIMTQITSRNISISIDDFGTGYSSLSYLKKFPIDTIKIDRSFISDLMQSEEDRKIVTSIIHLAHNLDLKVIAEGTENMDQILFLKEIGCEEAQGFYYSRPLPDEEYYKFIKKSPNLYKI